MIKILIHAVGGIICAVILLLIWATWILYKPVLEIHYFLEYCLLKTGWCVDRLTGGTSLSYGEYTKEYI